MTYDLIFKMVDTHVDRAFRNTKETENVDKILMCQAIIGDLLQLKMEFLTEQSKELFGVNPDGSLKESLI